jgi:glycosyltransferase involved in cell wall biosynthesis/GT2 family glycosyltransferase
MDAARVNLFVERLVEPYSGMPLVGVGGYCSSTPAVARVDVRYDGITATSVVPKPIANGPLPNHFAIHLPVEAEKSHVQVVVVLADGREESWYDESIDRIGQRVEATPAKHWSRFLSPRKWLSPRRWWERVGKAFGFLQTLRQKIEFRLLRRRFPPITQHDAFVQGLQLSPVRRAEQRAESARFRQRPRISILCPVYNVEPKWLRAAVDSVCQQSYDRWELCLADDASTNSETVRYLKSLVGSDPRIKITFRTKNGHICAATNDAASLATGDFIALLDNDDLLAPDALYHVARALQSQPDADLLYSDEDKVDAEGRRYDPQFKPDWSPELLLSYNYVNHFTVIRRSLLEVAGRFRVGYEGSQDHDLLLRVTERTDRVVHIPRILYHWRALPSSTAAGATVKQYVHTSGRRAIEEALTRRGIDATLYVPPVAERLNLPILALDGTDDGPSVAIVLTGPQEQLDAAERAICESTDFRPYTIVRNLDDSAEGRNRIAASRSESFLLFLDSNLVPKDRRWLSRLIANANRDGIGACGAWIKDEAGRTISAGVVHGMRDGLGPADAFAGLPADAVSYYFYAEVTRNVSAVSGSSLLTPRSLFERLGGFDADRFPQTTWDADYAARVHGQGLRCLHVGGVELMAKSQVDSRRDDPLELLAFRKAHGNARDPFANLNCSSREPFALTGDAVTPIVPQAGIRTLVLAHNLAAAEGAPRYLSDLIVGLADRQFIVPTVVSACGGAGEAAYTESSIPVELFQQPWGRRLIDGLWTRSEYQHSQQFFSEMLRKHRPELVVGNTLLTFPLIEAAARAGIPSVWIIHESYSEAVLQRLFTTFAKGRVEAAFRLATRIIPCSHDTAALFARLDARHAIRVVHNAIAPQDVEPPNAFVKPHDPAYRPRIIAVGTICERKGQHTLIEAAVRLARQKANFTVELIGARSGIPYLEYCRTLIARHGLESIVKLIPECDARPYFRMADLFVCTSHMETYSRSILEAEAYGLPIVSTPCSGVGEQVSWGFNALPFAIGDASALADQIRTLLNDRTLRERMARASRAVFELHPPFEAMLDSFAGVFQTAAGMGPWGQRAITSPTILRKAA